MDRLCKKIERKLGSFTATEIWGKTTSPLILPLPSRRMKGSSFKGKTNKNKQKEKKGRNPKKKIPKEFYRKQKGT